MQGNIEIRDDYDEEELKRWRQQRKEKVREAKVQENREEKGSNFDFFQKYFYLSFLQTFNMVLKLYFVNNLIVS